MTMSVSEAVRLEVRDVAKLEREVSVAELEPEPPMPEVTEVPRFEVPMLPEEAAVVESETVMRPMEFCACVR